MKPSLNRFLSFSIGAVAALASSADAVDRFKQNNTSNLNSSGSWNTLPTSSDVAVFDSTYTTTGNLNTGALVAWQGIRVSNPGGNVVINNSTSGQEVALGSAGIDMSAATVNLSAQRIRVDASQTWNVASGRTFNLGSSAAARAGVLTLGSGGPFTITKSGVGTVQLDTSNTAIGNVNWDIQSGLVRAIWNGSSAWGTGTITLGGGGIATGTGFTGSVGNWTWNNNITLTSSTSSFIDNQNIAGADRWLKLTGVISNSGNIEFRDTGTGFGNGNYGFILSGTNTQTGTVTIASGAEVRVGSTTGNDANTGNNGKLAGDSALVTNNGSLSFSRLDSHTVANSISGTGQLRIGLDATIGTATTTQVVTLTGPNSYTGATVVNNGTLKAGVASVAGVSGAFGLNSAVTIANVASAVIDLNGFDTHIGSLTGGGVTGGNVLLGANTLTIGGNNTSPAAYAGIISGVGGSLTKVGTGTLNLTGANTFSGGTTITGGVLTVGSSGAIGSSGDISMNGGTLQFSAANTTDYSSRLRIEDGKTATFDTNGQAVTLGTALSTGGSGTGSLAKTGSGTLTLSGTNTYTGGTTLTAGTLALGNSGALGSTGTIAMNGGTLQFSAANTIDYSSRLRIEDGKTATFDTNGQSVNFANSLVTGGSANGSLAKIGTGTLTLATSNSFTGGSTLSAGTLVTGHVSALGSGAATINGGTLDLDAHLTVATLAGSSSTVDAGGFTLTLNSASNVGTFYTGTFNSTGSLVLRGGSHTVQNNLSGAAGSGTGNFLILQNVGGGSSFHLDTGDSATSRRDLGWTNDSGTALALASLQGHGAIRGDAGTPAGGVRNIVVNQSGDTTFDGAILSHTSGTGALRSLTVTKQGAGSLTLAGFIGEQSAAAGTGADVVNLTVEAGLLNVTNSANGTATNGTAGTMTITGGTLAFSNDALGRGGASSVLMNGGTLRWNSGNTQDLTVSNRLALVSGKTATLDTNGNDVVFSNALGGGAINASLTKTGAGSLTLEGSNTYTGNTLVSNGTLVINGSVSTGDLTVQSGATLMGSGTIGGATTIDSGAIFSPGESPGLLTIDDALTLNGTTLMEIGGQSLGTEFDSVAVSGLLTFGGVLNIVSYNSYNLAQAASYTLFGVDGGETGTFSAINVGALSLLGLAGVWTAEDAGITYTFTEATGALVVVPEPAAALLGGVGMLILLRRRR